PSCRRPAARRARAFRESATSRFRRGRRSRSAAARRVTVRKAGYRGKPARMAPIARLRMPLSGKVEECGKSKVEGGGPPSTSSVKKESATGGRPLGAVAHPVDRAVVVVGDEQRPVFHDQ